MVTPIAASLSAAIRLEGLALPVPAISKAVPWSGDVRTNDYDFVSERALDACSTYGVESVSLAAVRA